MDTAWSVPAVPHDVIHLYKAMQYPQLHVCLSTVRVLQETKEGGAPFGKRARGRGGVEDPSALVDIQTQRH